MSADDNLKMAAASADTPATTPVASSAAPAPAMRSRYERPRRATNHSPIIIDGRPADLQPLRTVDLAKWEGKPVPERRWIVPDLIPEDECTLVSGDGGEGKTLLQLQLAVACVLGKLWLGRPVRKCRVLAVFCEDNKREIHIRLDAVLKHYGATFADIAEDLAIVCRKGKENALMEWRWDEPGVPTAFFQRVEALALDHGAELLILDSLHDLFPGDEIKRTHARQFVNLLAGIAGRIHGAAFLSMHPSLTGRNTGTGEAGSTAWRNASRSMLYLTRPQPATDERELKTMKANRTRSGGVIRVHWADGVFVAESVGSRPTNTVDKIDLDNRVLAEMRGMIEQGAELPYNFLSPHAFVNVVRKRPSFSNYDQSTILAVQKRLIDTGRACVVRFGAPSRARPCIRPTDMRYSAEERSSA